MILLCFLTGKNGYGSFCTTFPCPALQGMVRGFLKQQPVHWFTSQIVAALGYCRHYAFTLTWLVKNRSDKMIKDAELSEEQTQSRPFRAHAWLKTQQVSNTHSSTEKNGKIWSPIPCWSIIILLLEILGCYSLALCREALKQRSSTRKPSPPPPRAKDRAPKRDPSLLGAPPPKPPKLPKAPKPPKTKDGRPKEELPDPDLPLWLGTPWIRLGTCRTSISRKTHS